jgi:hypothetical protein
MSERMKTNERRTRIIVGKIHMLYCEKMITFSGENMHRRFIYFVKTTTSTALSQRYLCENIVTEVLDDGGMVGFDIKFVTEDVIIGLTYASFFDEEYLVLWNNEKIIDSMVINPKTFIEQLLRCMEIIRGILMK